MKKKKIILKKKKKKKIIYTERMNDVILNMINKCLSEENDEKSEEKSALLFLIKHGYHHAQYFLHIFHIN